MKVEKIGIFYRVFLMDNRHAHIVLKSYLLEMAKKKTFNVI